MSTVYDVKIRYLYEDRGARAGVSGLRQEVAAASRESSMFGGTLGKLAGLAAGAFGLHEAKKAFVDFNSDMQQSKITMAGLFQLNVGGEFADNMGKANDLVSQLQQRAKASVGTTKDMVEMASMISRPVTAAGASMKELEDVTVGAVVAARAFGTESSMAALDIEQALMGNLSKRDRFARALLEHDGMTTEKFNKLSAQKRLSTLTSALRGPAISEMAKAQEGSFAGVLSTFQDTVQMALGKVGEPLFKRITAELRQWNEWLDKNSDRLTEMGKVLGEKLVAGFEAVKKVSGFILDHWKEIAVIWAGAKVMGGGMNSMPGTFMGALSGATTKLGALGVAAGALYLALDTLTTAFINQREQARGREIVGNTSVFKDFNRLHTENKGDMPVEQFHSMFESLKKDKLVNDAGVVNTSVLQGIIRDTQDDVRRKMGNEMAPGMGDHFGFMTRDVQAQVLATKFAERFGAVVQAHPEWLNPLANPQAAPAALWMNKFQGDKFKTGKGGAPTININHIEVASEDPDRFVQGMTEAVSSLARNPASAVAQLRRGY